MVKEHVFFTWTAQQAAVPLEITGGEGVHFYTADGGRWWDLGSTTWNANLGHGHAGMKKAMAEAAARGLVAGPTASFPDKERAGDLLAAISPAGPGKAFLCLSGAEANENAVKMARMVTGKSKVIARSRSYHGATLGMLELSGDNRRDPFGLPEPPRMVDPYCYRCPFGLEPNSCARECARDLERAIREAGPEQVAAVILEGTTGANGVFPPPSAYHQLVREICDKYEVLWIDDEVLSGFGRTGRWFAVHDAAPDMVTCAKGLTAGYAPGGAVLTSPEIAAYFEKNTLWCGLTTYGHPLVCASIVAAITAYREEGILEHVRSLEVGRRLAAFPRPYLGEARGLGLLWALELVLPGTRDPVPGERMLRLAQALKDRRLHMFKRDNLLYYAPPLVITAAQVDESLGLVFEALDEVFAA